MRAFYDLHIHSCLSPCGDNDMTPNNIVGMSTLSDLNIIALTDHNACYNCDAVTELGTANKICVVSGMELTTSEEIHVVCLFPTVEKAIKFNEYVSDHQLKIKNREEIYGEQLVMNSQDEVIDKITDLLILSTDISIMTLPEIVLEYDGVCFPAHIDRDSYSVLSVLGQIPAECGFTAAEISEKGNIEELKKQHPILDNMIILCNSDAHYLENMREKGPFIELEELTPQCLINTLKGTIK